MKAAIVRLLPWVGRSRALETDRGAAGPSIANVFALAYLVCSIFGLATYGVLVARREARQLEASIASDLVAMGQSLASVLGAVRELEGTERAREVLRTAAPARRDVLVAWVSGAPEPTYGGPPVRTETVEGVRRVTVTVPFAATPLAATPLAASANTATGDALELSRAVPGQMALLRDELRDELVLSTVIALVAALLARLLGQHFLGGPLGRIIEQTRRIGAGDLSQRLTVRGGREMAALKAEINAMCDQLRAAREHAAEEARARDRALEQLRHADRLRTVGTLASGIAHELGTPLNVILLRARMLARGEVPPHEVASLANVIAGQTERVTSIVRQLLDFARQRAPRRGRTNLVELAERTARLLEPLAKKSGVTLQVDAHASPEAHVDPGQLEQALTNLLVNAMQASTAGSTVVIGLSESRENTGFAEVSVRDEGAGIAPQDLERIFEPFFTTKEVGQGTGLGLSVVFGIVEGHGGRLQVTSALGRGSTFTMLLPQR